MPYTPSDDYPRVVRMSDPLVLRLTKQSLLIGNVNFYAKIKVGYYFNGFQIYSSGSGTPIYEEAVESLPTTMPNGDKVNMQNAYSKDIEKAAIKWFDDLETRIAESTNDNSIQMSIDTLRWQMHYDLTKTSATLPDQILIDKSMSLPDLTNTLSEDLETIGNNVITLSDRVAPSGHSLYESISDVAQRIKSDSDVFTISRALRESNQSSISGAVYDQTQLIDTEFSDIENTIGSSSDTTNSTLFGVANTVNNQIGTDGNETVIEKLDTISSSDLNISQSVVSLSNKIGTNQDTDTGTLWFDVLHRAGTRSMPQGAQYQSDSPLGKIKTNSDSMYNALLGTNGALQQAIGYDYSTNSSGGAFVTDSGGSPITSNKYYMRTEASRFALVYNISGGVSANYAAVKSQPAQNQNPW